MGKNKTLIVRWITLMTILSGASLSLLAQEINPTFESSYQPPIQIIQKSEHAYFIDFGKAYFGTLSLHASASQDDSLVVHLGEKLSQENTVDRNPPGSVRYQKVILPALDSLSPFLLPLPKDRRNTGPAAIQLPDSFGIVMPFRYCEIENLRIPIEEVEIRQKAFYYRFHDSASSFTSSDSMLNQVWEICKHTIKASSFAGYYIDGDRERIPYEADAYINQLSHYAVDSVYTLARRTNAYFIDHPTWPTEWILHTAFLFYYDYLYTGDTKPIARHYPSLKIKTLSQLEGANGLISTQTDKLTDQLMLDLGFSNPKRRLKDIVDWPQGERDDYEMVEVNTVVNAFYYQNLKTMSKLAGAIGEFQDSLMYQKKAEALRQSINALLIDSLSGLYLDGLGSPHSSLHANMFPLAFDLVPDSLQKPVLSFIKSKGMACSVYGAQYLLEALCTYGEEDYALALITDSRGDRNWHNMIKAGSTLTWEAWDIGYKPNQDWNHAWATAPANIIVRYLWGIRPETPGFTNIRISPALGGLQHSRIKVPTQNGCILAHYTSQSDGQQVYDISIPRHTKARFYIDGHPKKVSLNGELIDLKGPWILLEGESHLLELHF